MGSDTMTRTLVITVIESEMKAKAEGKTKDTKKSTLFAESGVKKVPHSLGFYLLNISSQTTETIQIILIHTVIHWLLFYAR